MLLGEKPNDYDLYFKSLSGAKVLSTYYAKQFNERVKLPSNNNYKISIKEEVRDNIRGEKEQRLICWMQSAGVAREEQSRYEYFEAAPEELEDDFIDSLTDKVNEKPDETIADLTKQIKEQNKKPYQAKFFTDNAISLSNQIQIIIRFHGTIDEIHKNFDFVHCMTAYDYLNNNLYIADGCLESLLSKALIYKGSLYPISSIFRIRKFLNRGWRITAGQILKILWQVSEINLNNLEVLREQLLGVDAAYMYELVDALKRIEDSNRTIVDSTYLAKLIDRIFDET